MHRRITMVLAAIAVLCLAVAVPTASAAKKKTSKTDKAQSKTLKSHGKTLKSHGKTLKAHGKSLKRDSQAIQALGKSTGSATQAIKDLKVIAERADANAGTVIAAAPQIIAGLNALKDGLVAAGDGLKSLQTLATSTEYGIAQVTVVSVGPTANPQVGSFLVTPDLPDAVQQAQTTQQFVAANTGTLTLSYGVRSNETDGTGANNPAALCRTTVTNEGGSTESTTGGPVPGLGGFVPIPLKSALTSTTQANQGFPFGPKTSGADADNLTSLNTAIAVTDGDTYTVGMSCVDTSPSPSDPSA